MQSRSMDTQSNLACKQPHDIVFDHKDGIYRCPRRTATAFWLEPSHLYMRRRERQRELQIAVASTDPR